MKSNKVMIISFVLFYFIIFIIGFLNGNNFNGEVSLLSKKDIIYIFLINSMLIIFSLLLTPTMLSFIFLIGNIYNIGKLTAESGINFYIYLPISLLHGFFEIVCLYYIYKLTIYHILNYIKHDKFLHNFKKLIKVTLIRYIPISICILLIASSIEVLISNRLIYWLIQK